MPLRLPRLRLYLLIIIVMLLSAGCLRSPLASVVVSGELHGDLNWSGEVFIGGDVTLAADARLTIRPGTVVRFLAPENYPGGESDHPHFPGSELNIEGVLTAVGMAEAPIVFAAANGEAPAGSWGAVNFAEGSQGTFRYCIFRQADSAIHSREATVEVTESLFENNHVGIRFHTSKMRVEHNLLRGNGTGIRFHFGAPIVRWNRFADNRINLFITSHPSDYLIENNRLGPPLEYQVVLGEEVPEDVRLPNNLWDDLAADAVLERVFDGRRIPYLGRVQVEPLLTVSPTAVGPSWIR
ncbi:MAG: hypothetical protein NDI73_05500 [Desulfuromonadales bacterium]|nr:hypothetical protein [Desulfuromonadales bacterium]